MKKLKWTTGLSDLLIWMRSKKMSYEFCADIISREVKMDVSANACKVRHQKVEGKRT